jgi:Methyl-viologen-reducing hydrogenase, delta subunit
MEDQFEPLIIAFCCNWCSYAGADLAGVSRLQYPPQWPHHPGDVLEYDPSQFGYQRPHQRSRRCPGMRVTPGRMSSPGR